MSSNFNFGGRAVQRGLQFRVSALNALSLGSNRARNPVDRPQFVNDGATDASDGLSLKLDQI